MIKNWSGFVSSFSSDQKLCLGLGKKPMIKIQLTSDKTDLFNSEVCC